LRANGSRECAPDDRLREAIQNFTAGAVWIASSLALLAMTVKMAISQLRYAASSIDNQTTPMG
jgi:hypothetical protein